MHNIAQNLEAEFHESDLLPKTKEAMIMATAVYIAANAANDDEHMRHLRNLALEGVMSTHASVLVDSVGPPSAEICRAAASFP
jgi:hypothetical protein